MAEEREAAEESLAERNAELDRLRPGVEELQRRVEELQRRANVQARELERLRAGPLGLIRRAKARLMRSRG
jgi:chromosome segregation ATPase